jgi:pimeloyl-ACP methyl ester carboxylesterase
MALTEGTPQGTSHVARDNPHVARGTSPVARAASRVGGEKYVCGFDEGDGPPLVVITGLHGRWEWTRPALQHLAKRCRVVSYSLRGDIGSAHAFDPALGFDQYVQQLEDVMDGAGLERAAVCGVSFGGFVALRYAAARAERVTALVLASAPGPGWQPTPQQARWIAKPWLSAPVFVATAPFRLWPEIRSACRTRTAAVSFLARQGVRAATAPMNPSLMAMRIRKAQELDFAPDCARVQAPTLVLSGEEPLDRVVPVRVTRAYASLIHGARYEMMDGTGHLGVLTQPARFADIVGAFIHANGH